MGRNLLAKAHNGSIHARSYAHPVGGQVRTGGGRAVSEIERYAE